MRKNAVCFGAPLFLCLRIERVLADGFLTKNTISCFSDRVFFAPGVSFFAVLTVSLTVYIFPCAA